MNANIAGLICGFVGSLLLFFFGMPPALFKAGQYVADEPNGREAALIYFYKIMSWFGLLLLTTAFALQLYGSISH